MVASTCRVTIISTLRIRRPAVGSSSRWPHVGFEMGYIALDSPPSSTSIPSHHQTGGPTGFIGCEWTYARPSAISGAAKSTPIDSRGSTESDRPAKSDQAYERLHRHTYCDRQIDKNPIPKLFTRTVKTLICIF